MEQTTKTTYRVTFFPSGRATAHRDFSDFEVAKKFADEDVKGWAPMIEEQTVTTTPWRMIYNPSLEVPT